MNIAFIGLGVMGYPIAGHLAKANHSLTVYNRTTAKAKRWLEEFPGEQAATPAAASDQADVIIICVGGDDDLKQVVIGDEGIIHNAKPGAVLIDHTTTSAEIARTLSTDLRANGLYFFDSPVSGGQAGAENGQLTIMCGGDSQVFEQVKPVLQTYGKQVSLMGGNGYGQLTKMVNQICIAGLIQSLAEGVHFAQQAGLDVDQVFEVIGQGAAQSWQMNNRYKTMEQGEYNHGFAVDLMRKDLGICLSEARINGSSLPVAALIDQFYADIQQQYQGGRLDTSSLLLRLLR